MPKCLNVAIVGCGWVSDWHARDGFALLPDQFRITACCDTNAERLHAFAERYCIPHAVARYEDILTRDDLDVVAICTPPASHYPMIAGALAAGKHVVCEKPLTSSLALVDSIRALEARSRGRAMPIFQYRFGDGIAKVRHVIRSGIAGKHYVSSVETAKRRGADYYSVPWRGKFATELGGVLLTQAIHIHDLLLWLIGPAALVASLKTTRVNPIEVEDCAVASLRMADGSLASLTATLGSCRQLARLRLCFENVTFERQAYDEASTRPGDEPWTVVPKSPEIGRAIEAKMAEVLPAKSWFARQYELFHEAIATGQPFPVTLDDARGSLELITALFHSDETGTAVPLPIGPTHPRYDGWVAAVSGPSHQPAFSPPPGAAAPTV